MDPEGAISDTEIFRLGDEYPHPLKLLSVHRSNLYRKMRGLGMEIGEEEG